MLVVGLLRVVYFEKGPRYYWHDAYFLMKFAAFLIAALISIYPTITFLAWNRSLRAGEAPQIGAVQAQRVRRCLRLELASILVILRARPSWRAASATAEGRGARGRMNHAARAGSSTIAPSMFTRNMNVSMMPMSAWNFSGENTQVATPMASVMPVKMMLAPVTCSVRS